MAYKLILDSDVFRSKRIPMVKNLLEGVYARRQTLTVAFVPSKKTGNNHIIAVTDTSWSDNINDNRFKTSIPGIKASYYEIWSYENPDYVLQRAYFHLYKDYKNQDEKAYLLLHADPQDDDIHGDYKRSPHLHIKLQDEDDIIPHAHIALNLYDLDSIYKSIKEFDIAFKKSILMLKEQILDQW